MTEEAGPPQRPPSGGIVPLRPLDAGQIVGGALRFVRRVPAAVLPGLLLAVVVVGGLALQHPCSGRSSRRTRSTWSGRSWRA